MFAVKLFPVEVVKINLHALKAQQNGSLRVDVRNLLKLYSQRYQL